jgi:hypothetical protein
MGNECCHGKTVGWHWRVLGDAGFGYFELLESLWVVLAKILRSTLASQWHPGFGA